MIASKKEGAFLSGLRVRIKELAQEARYIKHEENKIRRKHKLAFGHWDYGGSYQWIEPDAKSQEYLMLRDHRRHQVRGAAREAQLAYAFLRGVPYSQVENGRKREKDYDFNSYTLKGIKRLVKKFGGKAEYADEVESWINTT